VDIDQSKLNVLKKHLEDRKINFAIEDLKQAGFEISYQKDPFADRTKVKGDTMWVIVAVKKR
jgi:hypothetical protein